MRLGTRRVPGGIELVVEDTGAGIRPEDLPKIFDPFFTTKDRGTGLGLAIAREIVEKHGGAMACASTPEMGARFTITLPQRREAELT